MASGFPTSLDTFLAYIDGTTIMEALNLNNMEDAIEKLQAKVGIDSSIVTSSHDYKLANLPPAFVLDGTTVFNAEMTANNTFQDLDVAALAASGAGIAAKPYLCFFEITTTTTDEGFAMKPKGQGSATWSKHGQDGQTKSACGLGLLNSGDFGYFTCATDANGVVQIGGAKGGGTTWTLKLLGYVG